MPDRDLQAGSELVLTVPDRELLDVRVEALEPGVIELGLLVPARTRPPVLSQVTTYLEYVSDDGVWRQAGKVRGVDHRPYDVLFGLLRFGPVGSPQLLQRREYVRARHSASIVLWAAGPDAVAQACRTVDVSGGGLLVRGLSDAAPGDELAFALSLRCGEEPIRGRCSVVRETTEGDHGVRFTALPEADRDRLTRFAYEQAKQARERAMAV